MTSLLLGLHTKEAAQVGLADVQQATSANTANGCANVHTCAIVRSANKKGTGCNRLPFNNNYKTRFMQIKTIQYNKVFNLGNYSNEKIGVEVSISEGEDPLEAFAEAKRIVEKSHRFFQDLPVYERAKRIVANPDDHTGRDVKASQEVINAFEENYPDYMQKFSMPIVREITQGRTCEDDYDEQNDRIPF